MGVSVCSDALAILFGPSYSERLFPRPTNGVLDEERESPLDLGVSSLVLVRFVQLLFWGTVSFVRILYLLYI